MDYLPELTYDTFGEYDTQQPKYNVPDNLPDQTDTEYSHIPELDYGFEQKYNDRGEEEYEDEGFLDRTRDKTERGLKASVKMIPRAAVMIDKQLGDILAFGAGKIDYVEKTVGNLLNTGHSGLAGDLRDYLHKMTTEDEKILHGDRKILGLDLGTSDKIKDKKLWDNPSLLLEPEYLITQFGDGIASIAPQIIGYILSNGSTLISSLSIGMTAAADFYKRIRKNKDVSESNALTASLTMGAISTKLNKLSVDKLLKKEAVKKGLAALGVWGAKTGTEMGTEYAEHLADAGLSVLTKEGLDDASDAIKIYKAIKKSAKDVEVLLTAGMVGGVTSKASMRSQKPQENIDGNIDEQVDEQTIIDEDIDQQPVIDEQVDENIDEDIDQQPVIDEQIDQQPIVDETIDQQPVIDEQVDQKPVIDEQINEQINEAPLSKKERMILKDIDSSLANKDIEVKDLLKLVDQNPILKNLKNEVNFIIEKHQNIDQKPEVKPEVDQTQDIPPLPDLKYDDNIDFKQDEDIQEQSDYLQEKMSEDQKFNISNLLGEGVNIKDIHSMFKGQKVNITPEGHVSVIFDNNQRVTIELVKKFDDGTIKYAIKTGQLDTDGRILGSQKNGNIKIDIDYANKGIVSHEMYHRFKQLNMITNKEALSLRREMRKLMGKNKLNFDPSKVKDNALRLEENEANMFSQILKSRDKYRETKLGKIIQKITDFLDGLLKLNGSSARRLAKQFESEKVFSRKATPNTSTETKFIMAGEKAKSHNIKMEDKAKKMLKEGIDEQKVWEKTGFIKSKEGKMKFELDDSKAKLIDDLKVGRYEKKLSEILKHDVLFKNYPQLKNITVKVELDSKEGFTSGAWNNKSRSIKIKGGMNNIPGALMHELTHGVQAIETFASGGSSKPFMASIKKTIDLNTKKREIIRKEFAKLKGKKDAKSLESIKELKKEFTKLTKDNITLSDPKKAKSLAYKKYKSLLGEIEAFDTMERLKLSKRERRKILPYTSQKIPYKNIIVKKQMGESFLEYHRKKRPHETDKEYLETMKEELKFNTEKINNFREYFEVTKAEFKTLLKKPLNKMFDFEFNQLAKDIEKFANNKSEKISERSTIKYLQQEKGIQNEKRLREIFKMPSVSKMTLTQLKQYSDKLNALEEGDVILSEQRMKNLEGSFLEDQISLDGVLTAASKKYNVSKKSLRDTAYKWTDNYLYDTPLAERSVFHREMVDSLKANYIKSTRKYLAAKSKLDELGKLALKSRPRSLKEKITGTQENVMKYIEADLQERIGLTEDMTNAEVKLAEFISKFYSHAYNHLLMNKDLLSSRYKDIYIMYAKKPMLEAISDMEPSNFKSTLKEIADSWKKDNVFFNVDDSISGKKLGFRKFMRQTLRRSGELNPSKNILRSTDIYMKQFYKKQGLDKSIPVIDSIAKALSKDNPNSENFEKFINEYLNNKKGQKVTPIKGFHQDGSIDLALRSISSFLSIRYIAGNLPLQASAIVGETMAKIPAIGLRKLVLANYRKLTPQGKKILKKYESYVGEGVFKKLGQPGQPINENINILLYGILSWTRKITNQDILLGNMTKTEFNKGTISPERLARVTRDAGRFLDMEGSKSLIGSTSLGGSINKFRGWSIPMVNTVSKDIASLTRSITRLGDKNKRLTKKQIRDFYRIAETGVILGAAFAGFGQFIDEDDDSYLGKFKKYIIRDLATNFSGLNPWTVLSGGVTIAFLERLRKNLRMIVTFEPLGTDKEKKRAKKRRGYGYTGLKKQFKPTLIEHISPTEKKK